MTNLLTEKYRPASFADVVGQDKAIKKILNVIGRGWGGRAWWISGASGTGKTTLARIIARQGADRLFVQEIDSSDLTHAALRDIEDSMSLCAWGEKSGRAYIVNEAHGLRRDVIRQLLVLLERLPGHCAVIFTTSKEGQLDMFEDQLDAFPLLSRCIELRLTNKGVSASLCRTRQSYCPMRGA